MRSILCAVITTAVAVISLSATVSATPPYRDPNQPYDRLPGTLQTPHVKWARPLAGGPVKGLFILPYGDSREVVEIAQRLQLDYTVIMNAGHTAWVNGYGEGENTTPLAGVEARLVLDRIASERLDLDHQYDVIVIGKVSWAVIPAALRKRILQHVARGSGLVYVTPHRLKEGSNNRTAVTNGRDKVFEQLFKTGDGGSLAGWIRHSTPLDTLPIHMLESGDQFTPLAGVAPHDRAQAAFCVTTSRHGDGRVVGLDYFDQQMARRHSNSLTPYWNHPLGDHDSVAYDYSFGILARCMLWSANRQPVTKTRITISSPTTELRAAVDEKTRRLGWHDQVPATTVVRGAMTVARITTTAGTGQTDFLDYTLRSRDGTAVLHGKLPGAPSSELRLPILPRGDYLVDVRLIDRTGAVIDFASTSLRVENEQRVEKITVDQPWYKVGQVISGKVDFSQPLGDAVSAEVIAMDTWGRTVAEATLHPDGTTSGQFSIPVKNPLSELWDVACRIRDESGIVDERSIPVPIPNRKFDDYMFMLIFSPTPGRGHWKGDLYGRLMRQHGINSTFTYLIYNQQHQFVQNARHHLQSVAYAEHHGELLSPKDRNRDPNQEQPDLDLAELSRMLREVARTGKKLDPEQFPFRMQYMGAEFINGRIDQYRQAARFGSPFYTLTGENYLSGEFDGRENSGFGATTTRVFQQWCRKQYGNSLESLNAEWNTRFDSWDQVRGILLTGAVEHDQLPRWVDFRYFMRSRVWSQYFIDLTRMMRRFIPDARTGRVGHDHHDFSRYRQEMTSSKLYIGQEIHPQWRHALTVELPQSFSAKRSFLMAPQSVLRWNYDHQVKVNRQRYPWLVLMLGLNGFDWENCLTNSSLGGLSCFTPDFSQALPFFEDYSREVLAIQHGIGKLTIASQPHRSRVAMLWAPYNHYISRTLPFEENGFSGTWMSNVSVIGGAPADALTLLNSIRIRPTIIAPEDLLEGGLARQGFRALVLPYNKGMSLSEADAIREFVNEGGLVIADNDPATYTEHGRKLKKGRLTDLFPVTDRVHLKRTGRGQAAYLPNIINGYTDRLEKEDFSGSDVVARLLREHAGQQPPVELLYPDGRPRRDVFARVFHNGSTQLLGLLCSDTASNQESSQTILRLSSKHYVYDVRNQDYLGFGDSITLKLDLQPRFLALLPARLESIEFRRVKQPVPAGTDLAITGTVHFNQDAGLSALSQAVHLRVLDAEGHELEWFRQNILFRGRTFSVHLPLSRSIAAGSYRVTAEHALTGLETSTTFEVVNR